MFNPVLEEIERSDEAAQETEGRGSLLMRAKDKRPPRLPHEETQEQQGGKTDLFRGTDVTWKGGGEEGGKTEGRKRSLWRLKKKR